LDEAHICNLVAVADVKDPEFADVEDSPELRRL
jgi:hypothetical protein